jgi:hypothetical protein
MLGALGLDGVVTAMTVDGFTDGDVFLAFLQDVLLPGYDQKLTGRQKVFEQPVCLASTSVALLWPPIRFAYFVDGDEGALSIIRSPALHVGVVCAVFRT